MGSGYHQIICHSEVLEVKWDKSGCDQLIQLGPARISLGYLTSIMKFNLLAPRMR